MQLDQLCNEVIQVATQAGKYILNERKGFTSGSIEHKGKNDLVSYVDKTAEQQIVAALKVLLPDAGFITEEKTENKTSPDYNWIIDPLDGTTNFIHGVPAYCVSIGLTLANELIMGVIYEPNQQECFYAWKGSKAFMNGKEIQVSSVQKLSDALLATGFPTVKYSRIKPYMEVFEYFMHHTHGLRRWGSAAIDLAYVACGRFEGFYEYGLNPWDVAAGAFIVQQAGGKITDFSRGANFLFGEEIIASNGFIHEEFSKVMADHFNTKNADHP